jgi:hypothetical protein
MKIRVSLLVTVRQVGRPVFAAEPVSASTAGVNP